MSEQKITKDMNIGDVIKNYPQTEKVIMKYFGNGCFSCPGSKMENLAFGATMHNVDVEKILKDLNDAMEANPYDKGA
ncbi:MAG: hypothetical protein A2073_08565 [Deltaproteobacteria bacterium GWC2_42_11]|nr:MAG: hypothetical protein A2073_08565 [Deltaproteobacteria bacterium GWC2_42_11]HBO83911.1 hypothetical protein [Deltaproteobacteria bacterium]